MGVCSEATAFIAGHVLLNDDQKKILTQAARETLAEELSRFETLAGGNLTIFLRWLVLNVEKCDAEVLLKETVQVWRCRRPTYAEITQFLRGYFKLGGSSEFNIVQVRRLAAELDRVEDGLPMRFQQLFFELAGLQEAIERDKTQVENKFADERELPDEIDLSILRIAIESGTHQFPPLSDSVKAAKQLGDIAEEDSRASPSNEQKTDVSPETDAESEETEPSIATNEVDVADGVASVANVSGEATTPEAEEPGVVV